MQGRSELRALLGRVRRRWAALVFLRTAGRACAGAAVPVFAALAVEWLLPIDGSALVLLGAVAMLASLFLLAAPVVRMQRRPDDGRVARFIEERSAAAGAPMDDALVSALAVDEGRISAPGFGALLVGRAVARLREIHPAELIQPAALRRAATEAAAGIVVLVLALWLGGPMIRRSAEGAWVALFPRSIQVHVTPGNTRVVAGQPVAIRAVLQGPASTLTRLTPKLTVLAGGDARTVDMQPVHGGFEYRFDSIDRTFTYRVAAGSAVSADYAVTAVFHPRVERIDLSYVYPAFTGLTPRDEEGGGDIYAPAGTRVRLRVHADKPVRSGTMALTASSRIFRVVEPKVLEAEIVLSKDDSYRVEIADVDGLRGSGDSEYYIRLMDDRPPEVRILRPAADQQITPLEEVTIEARADDDYGVARFELVFSVPGRAERTVAFARVSGTETSKVGAHLLPAEELGVQPGDVISYYARARDVPRGRPSTETRSDIFFLEVKPFSEEFVAAQSQAMGGGAPGDAQLEALIAAQKEIINATWNIERRAAAARARSVDDVNAVMQAQEELKARAERVAGRGRRGRPPFRMPQQISAPRQPQRPVVRDPVAAAVEAMERAVQELGAQRTRDAITHEMAALQGLLQAQAEVRRRQVMQQQMSGASSGGSARQGQDISALFDRELQRQQRTNYEQRSRIEERPEQRNDESALDRIRDLARRQEDLSRRQRELANKGLSPEELKRQLEQLTREQNELRQEAEDLERQMAQQRGSQSGQQRPDQQGQAGGSAMRDVSEQMRSAANDLRRDDAAGAAAAGERAAERLRRLEEQMRGGSPEARQRAAGELQLEAQQVADAQRRIAAEAERLEQAKGEAASDARRRLAGEKEQLAERVDDLQRRAEQLAKEETRTPGGTSVKEAAAELTRQQLGKRMRETAQQMRAQADEKGGQGDEKPSSSGAQPKDAEQQIARALDRVVEKLGGASGAEAKRLADELERTRGLRDTLNELERKIRQAEARQQNGAQPSPEQGQQNRAPQPQGGRSGGRTGGNADARELERLRNEYARQLQRAQQTLGQMAGEQRGGNGMSTPERHEFSRSAPGTEAFKQDFAGWESLRKEIDLALEKYEAAASARLTRKTAADRLNAGGSDRVPDAYKKLIAKYYESLAKNP